MCHEQVEADMRTKRNRIVAEREAGEQVIPIVQYADIASGRVSAELVERVHHRGAVDIRGTFPKEVAEHWDRDIAEYVETNRLDERLANAATDNFFGTLSSAKAQSYEEYGLR